MSERHLQAWLKTDCNVSGTHFPMKVVLVNHDKRWGGGQEFIRTLGVDLVRRGIALSVLCRRGTEKGHLIISEEGASVRES